MIKRIIAMLMLAVSCQGADVYLGNITNLVLVPNGMAYWYSSGAPATWQIPEFNSSVLYYKFDEATNTLGTIVDSSFIGTNTALPSAYWLASSNGISANYEFNNTSNRIDAGDSESFTFAKGTQDLFFAISSWVRPKPTAETTSYILSKTHGTTSNEYSIYYGTIGGYSNTFNFGRFSQGFNNVSRTAQAVGYRYLIGSWQHMVLLCQRGVTSTNVQWVINGNLYNSSIKDVGTYLYMTNRPAPLRLGANNANALGMIGTVDDVIFWTNLLTYAQCLDLYTNSYIHHGWSNSLAISTPSVYPNTVLELSGEYNYPADTSYAGRLNADKVAGSASPAWRTNATNGWWEFDGADDRFTQDPYFPSNNLTYNVWVNPATNAGVMSMIGACGFNGANDSLFFIDHVNKSILFSEYTSPFSVNRTATNTSPSSNRWTMLTCVYVKDATPQVSIYTNAVLCPLAVTNAIDFSFQSLVIGCRPQDGQLDFKGGMDHIVIANTNYSAIDITNIYNSTKSRYGL